MLKGEKIVLRPLKESDWSKTISWRNDLMIKKLAMMHPFPITEMVEKQWYEKMLASTDPGVVYFTITDNEDQPVGFISLTRISYTHRNCYLGIVIGEPEARGRGYGYEAVTLISEYAFNKLNLRKITVEVVEINKSALALYEKLGFIEEGRMKKQFYSDGAFLDVFIMSLSGTEG